MDETQKDNQDLVVGDDGSMNQESQQVDKSTENSSTNIEVKSDDTPAEEPINETTPPPADEIIKEDETVQSSDATAEDAVNFIAGSQTEGENTESSTEEGTEASKANTKEDSNEVVQAPVENTEDSVVPRETEATEDNSVDSTAAAKNATGAVVQPDKSGMSNNEHNNPHEHRNNKKLALIVTLVVALVLSGAAVYAYLSAQSNTEETAPSSNTSNVESLPVNEVTPATTDDIDETINDIDQTIDSLDNTEFSEDTISDDTLGL